MEFKINTPAGCPGGGGYKSSSILFYLFVGFCVYICVGLFINIRTKELSGKEAIPNIEFWREFPELVQEGITLSIVKVKSALILIKSKIQGDKSSAYNDI